MAWQGTESTFQTQRKKDVCPAKQVWSDGHASHSCSFSCFHSSLLPLPRWLLGQTSGPTHLSLNHFTLMCVGRDLRYRCCLCLCPSQVSLNNGPQLSLSAENNSGVCFSYTLHTSLMRLGTNNVLILSVGLSGRARRQGESLFLSNSKCLSWTYAQA